MKISRLPRADERIDITYLARLDIKAYDYDNLYPQKVRNILLASSTGSQCFERYARFIEGDGLRDMAFAESAVADDGTTADELVAAVARDLAMFGGFALWVGYGVSAAGYVANEVKPLPFEACRLTEGDDVRYIGRIAVHHDWTGRSTVNGRRDIPSEDTVQYLHRFNPSQTAIAAQVEAAGGIDFYAGQVLWVSTAGRDTYPTPKYDSVLTELSTDEGLSNVKFRNVRNNFLPSCMFITREGESLDNDADSAPRGGYAQDLARFQGDERSNNILHMTVGPNEEPPEIREFPTKNYDKDFAVTDASVVERIYSAFEQEPFLAIRNGKLGFSGDVIADAYTYYSLLVNKEQRTIERALAKVFANFKDTINPGGDYSIKPLTYIAPQ